MRGGRAANDYLSPDEEYDVFAEDAPEDDGSPIANVNATRVLILNASYEPLHVCSVKRAVALLMHDVAERVEDSEKVLRSPSQVFPVPSVIRLKKFVKRPPPGTASPSTARTFLGATTICANTASSRPAT